MPYGSQRDRSPKKGLRDASVCHERPESAQLPGCGRPPGWPELDEDVSVASLLGLPAD